MRWLLIPLSLLLASCVRVPRAPAGPGAPDAPLSSGYSLSTPTGYDPGPLLAWASWIGIAATLLLLAAAVAVPIRRGLILTLAMASGALVVGAYVMGHVLAWLPIISLLLAIAGLAYLVWVLVVRLRAAIRTVEVVADHDDPAWPAIKGHMIQVQGGEKSGVHIDLDRLAHKMRKKLKVRQ